MKTKNYLNKTSKHLFQFTDTYNGGVTYMKVLVDNDENKFKILKFNKDLDIISDKEYNIRETKSVKGKEYVDTELKNYKLFYKGCSPYYKIKSVKHFKKFRKVLQEYKNNIIKEEVKV